MGLSSSQARLLSLTGRMHDIEYKAQKLEAQKLQMANESAHVYQEYENALNATKIQLRQMNSDGSSNFVDATYQKLVDNGYYIQFLQTGNIYDKNGQYTANLVAVTQTEVDFYNKYAGAKEFFIAYFNGRVDETGYNSNDNVYEIYTQEHLQNLNNNKSASFRLMSNIALNENFTKLTLNGGTFDGNGYTISGLTTSLFSSITNNATVKNLNLSGNITTHTDTNGKEIISKGMLADSAESSTISDITTSGYLESTMFVGGLIGNANNVTIENCSSSVNVNATSYCGGLVGQSNKSTIKNCSVDASLTGMQILGGLIGQATQSTIEECSTDIEIQLVDSANPLEPTSYIHTGGLVGNLTNGSTVTSCSASGTITNNNDNAYGGLGGLIGQTYNHKDASNKTITISNCESDVNIINKVSMPNEPNTIYCIYIGGFLGDVNEGTTKIYNSDSLGTIENSGSGKIKVGGFVPGNYTPKASATIDDCYAAGFSFADDYTNMTVTNIKTEANNNNIEIDSPEVKHTTALPDPGNYGVHYDAIAANKYYIPDTTDPTNGYKENSTWFVNMINNAQISLYKMDDEGTLYEINIATDTNLQEVSSDIAIKKAEAKYEADMRKINNKDKKFDTDLASLEQERSAIKTEMDTLKTVAKDNVDRTFKLFS